LTFTCKNLTFGLLFASISHFRAYNPHLSLPGKLADNLFVTPCAENISSCGRAACIMICESCRKLLTRWPETCLKDLNKRRINNKDEDFKASVVIPSFVFDQDLLTTQNP